MRVATSARIASATKSRRKTRLVFDPNPDIGGAIDHQFGAKQASLVEVFAHFGNEVRRRLEGFKRAELVGQLRKDEHFDRARRDSGVSFASDRNALHPGDAAGCLFRQKLVVGGSNGPVLPAKGGRRAQLGFVERFWVHAARGRPPVRDRATYGRELRRTISVCSPTLPMVPPP